MVDASAPGVPEVFANRNIFITGGTGFIGKVLVEKLLRSCPQVHKIFILMREKRGKSVQQRLNDISSLPLFDKLHSEHHEAFATKVIPIDGDVKATNLGLSTKDRRRLQEEVDMVYHVAATVKFDEPLKEALLMNVKGTFEVCKLSLEMTRLKVFVHVSTAYAHLNYNPIEEKMYPPIADWRRCLQAAERLSEFDLSKVQALFMGPFPNTYTFSKNVAEHVVFDMMGGKVPNLIIRPSIVSSSWKDPIPGWIDNFNGPVGLTAACGTGLVRICLLTDRAKVDVLAVDLIVRYILNATWHKLTSCMPPSLQTSVHNASDSTSAQMTSLDISKLMVGFTDELASAKCVWYPTARSTSCFTVYYMYFMCLQFVPALFLDLILRILKYPPAVLRLQRRLFVGMIAMKHFFLNGWLIDNESLQDLEWQLLPRDREDFGYQRDQVDVVEYSRLAIVGGLRYLLKQDMTKMGTYRKRIKILKYLDWAVTIFVNTLLLYLLVIRWNVALLLVNMFWNHIQGLTVVRHLVNGFTLT